MTGLLSDIRYALTQLRKSPAFVAVAAGTLALGIGATTVVFTCVESFLLKPVVALVASWIPLRRALALDPIRALHAD